MSRPRRKLQDAGVYHLISRGNNKRSVFELDGGYQKFKEILLLSRLKFDWRIYHYCFMPNHVHILAFIERGEELPKIMQVILQTYSRWYRAKTGYVGYLWQGRYKSPLIDHDSYLLECGRYIERNPIRANMVPRAEDYFWSSYKHYALGMNDSLIYPNPTYHDFGADSTERQKNYREFVRIKSIQEPLLDKALISNFF